MPRVEDLYARAQNRIKSLSARVRILERTNRQLKADNDRLNELVTKLQSDLADAKKPRRGRKSEDDSTTD